jgi:hypothetical protein
MRQGNDSSFRLKEQPRDLVTGRSTAPIQVCFQVDCARWRTFPARAHPSKAADGYRGYDFSTHIGPRERGSEIPEPQTRSTPRSTSATRTHPGRGPPTRAPAPEVLWLEKGSDFSVHTPEDFRQVTVKLNRRPRPTLKLETPTNQLNQLLNAA